MSEILKSKQGGDPGLTVLKGALMKRIDPLTGALSLVGVWLGGTVACGEALYGALRFQHGFFPALLGYLVLAISVQCAAFAGAAVRSSWREGWPSGGQVAHLAMACVIGYMAFTL